MNSKSLQNIASSKSALKTMATPQKMQHYMEKHRLGPLFENLMNKVLHEQPDDPLVYLIKALYRKAGLEVPPDLKLGRPGVRHSSPEKIAQRGRSPELGRKSTTQAWASESAEVERSYDKPWLPHSKKSRPKTADEHSPSKLVAPKLFSRLSSSVKPLRSPLSTDRSWPDGDSLEDILTVQAKPLTPGRKPQGKQAWNADTKVPSTSFDDLFQDSKEERKSPVKREDVKLTESRRNWATAGLDDDDIIPYTSGSYHGPKHIHTDNPLAGEIMNYGNSDDDGDRNKQDFSAKGRMKGRDVDTVKHQRNLEKILKNAEQHSDDSGYLEKDEPDDAIELLEDAEDLKREGVTNIPASGYKLSKVLRQRQEDAKVKLNINLYPGTLPSDSFVGEKFDSVKSIESFKGYESDDERPQTGMSGFRTSPGDSDVDDEFESVSQVTGPRRPVWNVGEDSDVEPIGPQQSRRPPSLSQSRKITSTSEKKFSSTMPARFEEPLFSAKSRESAEAFLDQPMGKTWAPDSQRKNQETPALSTQESVRSEAGVWQIPRYDSDSSVNEWSQHAGKSKGRRPPPRAY